MTPRASLCPTISRSTTRRNRSSSPSLMLPSIAASPSASPRRSRPSVAYLHLVRLWSKEHPLVTPLHRYTVTPITYRERQNTTAFPLTFRVLEPLRLAFVYELWHMLCGVLEELGQLIGPARLEAAYELLVQVCGRASPGPSALRHKPRAVLYQPVAWVETTKRTENTARLFLEVVS